ncbi:unnamed protein product [Owenia fusiformis]|uniref:Fibronectin type-III domain-containing protein n=1 Tax=Owenia fusiformis TaxID=6347 RepID=A0A8S4PYW8_OWEFU|nr:unnamed protein product [Owenia fusiformis]
MGTRQSKNIETCQDKPSGSPVNLILSPINSISLNISWGETVLPNGIITNYSVMYWEDSKTRADSVNVTTAENNIVIGNLSVYTGYAAVVRAFTEIGGGPWSDKSTGITGEEAPSDAPSNVSLIQGSHGRSLTVTFKKLNRPNGQIITYESYIHNLDSNSIKYQNNTASSKDVMFSNSYETTITITDLKPFTNYSIKIRAYTSVGSGPWSGPVKQRTNEAAPGKVSNFKVEVLPNNFTTVRLTWDPPITTERNGILKGYVISEAKNASTVELPVTSKEHIVTGLHGHTKYSFSIAAITVAVGEIDKRDIRTPQGPPTVVRNLQTPREGITDRSIVVIWEEPEIPHGIIRQYIVRYRNSQSTGDEISENGTTTATTLDNLAKGTTYTISVAAETVSEGPSATTTASTTSQSTQPAAQVGAIVGGSLGGVLFLVILVLIIVVLIFRRKRSMVINKEPVKGLSLTEYDDKESGKSEISSNGVPSTEIKGADLNDLHIQARDERLWRDKKW